MKRVWKSIGLILGGLIGISLLAAVAVYFIGKARLQTAPEIATKPVAVPIDEAALSRGKHLVNTVTSCRLCHGSDLGGDVLIDGEMGLYVTAPNLTAGEGGIGAGYSAADWERAIRHGVGGDGRVLAIMPANFYQHLRDADLGAMIAYLQSVPPVNGDVGQRQIGFLGNIFGGIVGYDEFTRINGVDHDNVGMGAPGRGETAAHGKYLTQIGLCRECHAANLAGIVLAAGEDGPPEGPNLTPGGTLDSWTAEDFITTLRTGRTPAGGQLDPEQMPWPTLGQMSDVELLAIWTYLVALPALPTNEVWGG